MVTISLTIDEASRACGLSRSRLYEILGRNEIEAKKQGKRTLIVAESLRKYIDNLPAAVIRPPASKAA